MLMNQSEIKEKKSNRQINQHVLDLVYIAMFTAIITVCSQIQIPTEVPFTLQTLGIFAAGGLLGWKRGTLSVLLYILLGLIGIPVFAGFSGGIAVLLGPTGGYIIGFIFTALVVGFMCDKLGRKIWVVTLSSVLGLLVCYAFGTGWFMYVYNSSNEPIGLMTALLWCVVPYLLFDAAKIACVTILVNRLDKVIQL